METFNKENRWIRVERCGRWMIVLRVQMIIQSSISLNEHKTWGKSVLLFLFYFLTDFAFLSTYVQSCFWQYSTDKISIYAEAAMHLSFQWVKKLHSVCVFIYTSWVLIVNSQPLVNSLLPFSFKYQLIVQHCSTLILVFLESKWLIPKLAMVLDSH